MLCSDILPFINEKLRKLPLHMEGNLQCEVYQKVMLNGEKSDITPRCLRVKSALGYSGACFHVLHGSQENPSWTTH